MIRLAEEEKEMEEVEKGELKGKRRKKETINMKGRKVSKEKHEKEEE